MPTQTQISQDQVNEKKKPERKKTPGCWFVEIPDDEDSRQKLSSFLMEEHLKNRIYDLLDSRFHHHNVYKLSKESIVKFVEANLGSVKIKIFNSLNFKNPLYEVKLEETLPAD